MIGERSLAGGVGVVVEQAASHGTSVAMQSASFWFMGGVVSAVRCRCQWAGQGA